MLFKNENEFSSDKFQKILETLLSPALLLDSRLRVSAMNAEAKIMLFEIAEGEDILPYLSESAAESIAMMISGEICTVDFVCDSFKGSANVISGNGERLLILATAPYRSRAGIFSDSGYGRGEKDEETPESEKLVSRLREEHYKPRLLPFFESGSLLTAFKRELEAAFPETAKRLILHSDGEKYFAKGSERDFALITAELTCFCLCASDGGYVDIFADCEQDELVLSVSCVPSKLGFAEAESGINIEKLALLASGNLWELTVSEQSGDRLAFSLRMPFVKSGEEFLVRDISAEFLRELVASIFAGI